MSRNYNQQEVNAPLEEAKRILTKYVAENNLEVKYDINDEKQRSLLCVELVQRKISAKRVGKTKYITYEAIYDKYNPVLFNDAKHLEDYSKYMLEQHMDIITTDQNKEITENQERIYKEEFAEKISRHKRAFIERTANKQRRDDAVNELIADDVREYLRSNPEQIEFNPQPTYVAKDSAMIVNISDLHFGKCVDVGINTINKEILERRIQDYSKKCIDYIKQYKPKTVVIAILGDTIEGLIHVSSVAESDIPSASVQATAVAEVLWRSLIKPIAETANKTIVCGVSGNHGRTKASKNEVTLQDTFFGITMGNIAHKVELAHSKNEISRERLQMDRNYSFDGNYTLKHPVDYTYCRIKLFNGKKVIVFVHGDKIGGKIGDKWTQRVARDSRIPDYTFAGHFHANAMMTSANGSKIYFNGSVCGPDTFAVTQGLIDKPSQKIFIIERNTIANDFGGITEEFIEHEITVPLVYGFRGTSTYDVDNEY